MFKTKANQIVGKYSSFWINFARIFVMSFFCFVYLLIIRLLDFFSSFAVSSMCPSNVTSVPCGHPNVSEVQCLNSGCCWNVSSGASPIRCYGIANNHSVVNSTVAMTTVKTPSTKVNQSTIAG